MELVGAHIDNWDEESPFPYARVSHIFGRGSEMEPQINAILFENAIYCSEFYSESLSCLPSKAWEVPAEELTIRRDLRNLCIFTIDPSTATDLDDALSFERLPNGSVRVGVHIADVSYFVLPDTALDKEAQSRSTSVYMLRRKLPMLPPLLSENLGSLNPGEDRLAFSIFWDLNSVGEILDHWIGRTVIRSCCKLSYELALDMVDGMISEETCDTLGNRLPRCMALLNGQIMLCEQEESSFLVEEFMLLANRTAAEIISRAFPDSALLRRHPEPNMRKLREFEAFCCKHGLEMDTSSGHFHQSLEHIREKLKDDSVLFDIVMSYASRPMQLATYFCSGVMKDNINDWGHYALAIPFYTHFTSPLRRYPDIVVHRTLAAAIEAEELYTRSRKISHKVRLGEELTRFFTGIYFDKDAAESSEGREALSAAAIKHRVPCTELLAGVAAYSNDRKLASRHVKDACDKLCMWVLLKKKEFLLSDARVLGLGPRFMTIYIQKLAIERRIYYEEVEGLTVEWLEATSTLVLNLCAYKRTFKRASPGNYRALNEVAWVISPCNLNAEAGTVGRFANECNVTPSGKNGLASRHVDPVSESEIEPVVFPLTVRLLSTIPVALHAVGGDDGPIDIGVRLYYKLSTGGEVIRTDIQVGDDTLPFFSVSLWQKQMAAKAVAGDVVLLQNVKIAKFGCVVDARTVQFSSLKCLIHPYELLISKGVDDLIGECRVGKTTMEKFVKVIKWVQRAGSSLYNIRLSSFQKRQLPRNWTVPEQSESRDIFLLSEVLQLRNSCKAVFNASAGEIFLPITWRALGDSDKEKMFVSRRINNVEDSTIAEDFTCVGCQLCGSPLDSENRHIFKQNSVPLYCPKSSDHLHIVGMIYRPFMLYVWDESEYLPLFVRNKAAELLFGNIKAERVYSCYKGQKNGQNCDQKDHCKETIPKAIGKAVVDSCSSGADKSQQVEGKHHHHKKVDFRLIWLILLKMLLQQGNSPLKFEVNVNTSLDMENGKFEMVSVSVPCIRTR
ncbi:hypothetical protein GH714_024017 [Hevea brasiliensis]|uniref:RNB domain-containing protein n=1 Tax=Hevea brasiliensis TaxID=3981 RepID=A0A6A6KR53_HEVBR|nr:hypothetical protein GH714_024017 [Hevea brasiliensis]